jgi:hypothetical protein
VKSYQPQFGPESTRISIQELSDYDQKTSSTLNFYAMFASKRYMDAAMQTNLLTLRVNPFNLVNLRSSSSSNDESRNDSSSSADEVLPFSIPYAGEDIGPYSLW